MSDTHWRRSFTHGGIEGKCVTCDKPFIVSEEALEDIAELSADTLAYCSAECMQVKDAITRLGTVRSPEEYEADIKKLQDTISAYTKKGGR